MICVTADVLIRDEGTVWCFSPQTEAVLEWIDEGLEIASWQWLGWGPFASFGVDHRAGRDLVEVLVEAGFTVEGL
jgi:hypothetical protein